jgi:hypothetical protein
MASKQESRFRRSRRTKVPEKKPHNRQRAPLPKRISGGGIVLALTHDEVYFETAGVLAGEELQELMRQIGRAHV